nr:hypothetical protein [Tanacetum cinerariifolium]
MTESPLVDSGFTVPVFSLRDDLITCLNKAMAFLTAVASSRDLHTTNFDQFYAYLKQHELYVNEVYLLYESNQDPLAFVANKHMIPPHFNTYQSSYNNPQLQQQFPPSQYGLIHLTQYYSSTYPSQPQFNHSSIPPSYPYQSQMNHQTSFVPQVNYQSPQVSTQPMTESPLVDSGFTVPVFSPRDDLITCLNKAMAFLTAVASSRFPLTNNQLKTSSNLKNQATIQYGRVTVQQVQGRQWQSYSGTGYKSNATSSRGNNASGHARVLNTITVKMKDIWLVLMANISNYGSDVISEVPHFETYLNDMENQSVHAMKDFKQSPIVDFPNNKAQQDSMILSVIEQMSEQMINHVNN